MQYLYNSIKADYLQRTRTYLFLITLAVTVFMAYSFVPSNQANYTTLSASAYKGAYNSAWVGYVSGIMTTVMLSFYGFLLVNGGIKKDIDTEVGMIIATTSISNFKYLLIKQLSNYVVLLTIASITFLVSIFVFFIRGDGYPFIFGDFVFPYLFFAVPALFVVASLAVVAEVLLPRHSLLQFIGYFFLCGICMSLINVKSGTSNNGIFDPFGLSLITQSITQHINANFNEDLKGVSFGFIFNGQRTYRLFIWNGLNWSSLFIISRFLWFGFGLGLVYLSSLFFHRFDLKQMKVSKKKKTEEIDIKTAQISVVNSKGIKSGDLPMPGFNYGIFSLLKTELLLLIRQGNKWMWLLNLGLWIAMVFVPFDMSYSYLLPIILFLQVGRWSELVTKEKTHRIHYFAYASYKPLQRLLPAQILAGILLAIALSLPVILRSAIMLNGYAVINVINGAVLVVLFATAIGILTGGKKLFEILFFLITYSVLNKVPFSDYLGSLPHQNQALISVVIFVCNLALATVAIWVRGYHTRHL